MMDCYTERAHLLALLAKNNYACVYQDAEGEEGFKNVIALGIDGRWLTWHVSDSDMHLFVDVPTIPFSIWDGHTTAEKYVHILDYVQGTKPILSPDGPAPA